MAFFSPMPGWQLTSVSNVHAYIELFVCVFFCKNIPCSQLNLAIAMNCKPQQKVVR